MDDAELTQRMDLAELEHRCVQLGRQLAAIADDAGYGFDAETFVVAEIIRASLKNEADPAAMLEMFRGADFVRRVVADLDARD
jgi:hypothetical protein